MHFPGSTDIAEGGNKLQILRPSLGLKLFEVEYQVSVSDLTKVVRSKLLKTQSGSAVASFPWHEHFSCEGQQWGEIVHITTPAGQSHWATNSFSFALVPPHVREAPL